MTPDQRDETIKRVLGAVLGLPVEQITDDTSPDTVEAWDSVTHLNLVLALEEAFQTGFTPEETLEMTRVGRIRRLLAAKGV